MARAALERWLPDLGIGYAWEPRLGGWRKPDPDSPNLALRNPSFRGYADYMLTPTFWAALDDVLAEARRARTAVMCSESVYWRCHRRLIADAAELGRQVTVVHLGHDGRCQPHRLTEGVRAADQGVRYDVGSQLPLQVNVAQLAPTVWRPARGPGPPTEWPSEEAASGLPSLDLARANTVRPYTRPHPRSGPADATGPGTIRVETEGQAVRRAASLPGRRRRLLVGVSRRDLAAPVC